MCELCTQPGGTVIVRTDVWRIVLVDDPAYPGFCRVIVNAHIREMTDLTPTARAQVMAAVWAVEAAQRHVLRPHKINVASLGNLTPHLHWHVIPRFEDDAHFPQPIWGQSQRTPNAPAVHQRRAQLDALAKAIEQNAACL